MSLTLIAAFFISIFMHAGLVVFGPDIHYSDPPDIETDPVEVSMIAREVPIPDALRLKPLPLVSKPAPLDLKRLLEKPAGLQASLKPSFKADPTLQRIKKAPKSRPLAGAPELNLPKRVTTLDQLTRAKLKTLAKAGEEEAFPLAVPAPSAGLGGRKKSVLKDRASQFVGEELTRLTKERAPVETRRSISGPAATRRIIFRPPPPKAGFSGSSGDITLRFWVLSDGTVGRVIPVRKGNADLEGVAANHMKRWRFSPLPPGEPEREEWGLVVFRFRVR